MEDCGFGGLLDLSPDCQRAKPRCSTDLFGAVQMLDYGSAGQSACGGSASTSLPRSCSDIASLDSETTDSFCWQPSCGQDSLCAASPLLACDEEDVLGLADDFEEPRVWGRAAIYTYIHSEADEVIREELCKEAELGPSTATPIQPEHRGVLVRWMREVCVARGLSPATLFAATSFLDRFLRSMGEGATPPSLLQLLALTCLAVATKNEQQQCAAELLSLARDEQGQLYQADDARKMELHLLQTLGWRLRVPTIYTFLSMFLHRIANRPQDGQVVPPGMAAPFRALAMHLAELALMDSELTGVSYSTLAVACVLVAETEVKGGQLHSDLRTVHSLRTVQGPMDLTLLSAAVQRLYGLYKEATTGMAA